MINKLSHRQFNDGLALLDTHEIVVQEVNVETGLEQSWEDLSPAVEIVDIVAVDPVQDIEETIETEGRHVMRGYVLYHADFVQHYDLRDEGNGLEPETVRPDELPRSPAAVYYQCQYEGGG